MIKKTWSKTVSNACSIFISIIIALTLMTPCLVWAADVSVIVTPKSAYAGDDVTVSGTADPEVWVTIKVLESNGSIVHLNSILSNSDGSYSDIFKVPDLSAGELQIVAGYGSNISTSSLTVKKKSSSGSSSKNSSLNFTSKDEKVIEIKTNMGTATLLGDVLENGTSENTGNIEIVVENVEKKDLNTYDQIDTAAKEKIGDRPIIEICYKENGQVKSWENKDAPVSIAIPYTLRPGEDSEHIVVWYIDEKGSPIAVSNGRYNSETEMVKFHVTHFSTYAIAYVENTFKDLDNYMWAKHPIEVLSSKGVINGTGNDNYSPGGKITRADFSTLLVRTLELDADYEINFDDVHQTDYYYDAVGIAKELGITAGIGNNVFNPQEYISRQDMMVMVDKALRIKGITLDEVEGLVLDNYTDKSEIALYAMESVKSLVSKGIITGSNNKINSLANVTRAEAAAVMYRVYNME